MPMLAQGNTLTKEANLMCDSDDISIQRIPFFHAVGYGEGLLWEFPDIEPLGRLNIVHRKDSLGVFTMLTDRDITYYKLSNDTLYAVGMESPLIRLDYSSQLLNMNYPFSYGDSISRPFIGEGVYCGDHPFREQGTLTIVGDATGSMIVRDDTLPDVLRTYTLKSYSICMDIDSAALDTARLKQVIEERYDWYARGYRYPVFTTLTSTSYNNMQEIGTVQKAYCMLPDTQCLLIDSVNEDIRRTDSLLRSEQARANMDIMHYTVSINGNIVSIEYSLDEDANVSALISDTRGIIYRRNRQYNSKGSGYYISLDCSGLNHGQYILYINVNGNVYNQKITIQ